MCMSEDIMESASSSHLPKGSQESFRLAGLQSKCLCPLSHLASLLKVPHHLNTSRIEFLSCFVLLCVIVFGFA